MCVNELCGRTRVGVGSLVSASIIGGPTSSPLQEICKCIMFVFCKTYRCILNPVCNEKPVSVGGDFMFILLFLWFGRLAVHISLRIHAL